jgi:hypothetical protein
VVKPTASTGERAASTGRQLSYAEVGAAYSGVVAGRPVEGATAGVDSSAPLPTKNRAPQEGKGGRNEKASRGTPPVSKFPRGRRGSRSEFKIRELGVIFAEDQAIFTQTESELQQLLQDYKNVTVQ